MVTMFRGRHEKREGQALQHEHPNGDVMPQIESEFRELVRRRAFPKARTESGNGDANDINSLAQSISGPAVLEIEKLITQLHDIRDHLVYERQRVERAIIEYAQMSEAATKSTKIIADSLAKWAAENRPTDRASAAVPQAQGEGSEPPTGNGQAA
jgi:uncharacterized membrane protein